LSSLCQATGTGTADSRSNFKAMAENLTPLADQSLLFESSLDKKSPNSILGHHPWQRRFFQLLADRLVYKKSREDDDKDLGS
jgi:hypothetical protein